MCVRVENRGGWEEWKVSVDPSPAASHHHEDAEAGGEPGGCALHGVRSEREREKTKHKVSTPTNPEHDALNIFRSSVAWVCEELGLRFDLKPWRVLDKLMTNMFGNNVSTSLFMMYSTTAPSPFPLSPVLSHHGPAPVSGSNAECQRHHRRPRRRRR